MTSASNRFPRSDRYHPDWIKTHSMGSNAIGLTEWLTSAVELRPGMRVLDLGCGRAITSIFLAREFDVQVWATDLWISATENCKRIQDSGLQDRVFPIHADAHALPYASEFFDAILCIDAFPYFGSDSLYLNYLASFAKPGAPIGIAGAGLVTDFQSVPDHLQPIWTQDFWALHSATWWRSHWERTGIVDIETADTMPDGWRFWLDWQSQAHPENKSEIQAVRSDQGRYLGYIRVIGRRCLGVDLESYCWPDTTRSLPEDYKRLPMLRD